jgi:hypothetical protein
MKVLRLLLEALREIFEESAYARFCAREGLPSGRDSYLLFLRNSETVRRTRARCC